MKKLIPALIGAGVCLLFIRSGALTFFFLAPLGFVAFRYNYRIAWSALLIALLGNALITLGTAAAEGFPAAEILWDLLYFSVMTSIFTWIVSPPPGFSAKLRGSVRFLIGSCAGAVLFAGIFYRAIISPGFAEYVRSLLDGLISLYSSAGSDVVQNALLESLTAETTLNVMLAVILRGGSLVSCVFLFFISRQISLFFASLFLRRRGAPPPKTSSLAAFHVHSVIIWVLSLSLLLVVLARIAKLEIPEIFLWNILVLCIIMYLAQGLGILQFFLARSSMPPFLRFVLIVLFIILVFSPVLVVLLVGIILLGIAENWVAFRAPKPNGPPSTPEAGDGGS